MRFLKLVFISIIVLFIVVTFVFSLFPADIHLSRVISIQASHEKIAAVVNDLNTWKDWNTLVSGNSSPSDSVSNPSSGEGAFIERGPMRIIITRSSMDTIATHWEQKGNKQFNGGFAISEAERSGTYVEWYFDFHFRWYPWEKLGSIFYDKQIGPLMEKSLVNLKSYIENH